MTQKPGADATERERRTLTAFDRLRRDAILSDWKPTGDGRDVPDIPEFLRRNKDGRSST